MAASDGLSETICHFAVHLHNGVTRNCSEACDQFLGWPFGSRGEMHYLQETDEHWRFAADEPAP
jgi:hypothetical protein